MTHLLDTHVRLWMVGDHDRLGRGAREVVEDPERDLYVGSRSLASDGSRSAPAVDRLQGFSRATPG